ncbi:hypothetical protein [Helicobacter pylori]|uniref:hypothetical protein n=1 Tax=Helicobacter pylori TaxID=210 RepID=UPI001EE7A3DD|nr:hypothetical protein [Helicobacter pylori]
MDALMLPLNWQRVRLGVIAYFTTPTKQHAKNPKKHKSKIFFKSRKIGAYLKKFNVF